MVFLRASQARISVSGLRLTSRGESGQALIEYALIISLIALVAIAALSLTGVHISTLLNKISGDV